MGPFNSIDDAVDYVTRRDGLPPGQIATCPTADRQGIADGRGVLLLDTDNRRQPLAILLRERIGEPAGVSKQP